MASTGLPPYIPHPPTQYSLDYAPLAVIDLSTYDRSSEDRARLAEQLKAAVHNTGFWVVTGHGITDDEVNRQLSIGQAFHKTPLEDKRQYTCNFADGRSVHTRCNFTNLTSESQLFWISRSCPLHC